MMPKHNHLCSVLGPIFALIARGFKECVMTLPPLMLGLSATLALPLFALTSSGAAAIQQPISVAPAGSGATANNQPIPAAPPAPDAAEIRRPLPVALPAPAENLRGELGKVEAITYVVGDHLKIAFFERIDSGDDAIAVHTSSSELVERVELSGEYIVQENGYVFLPLVGSVEVAAKTPQQVQDCLAALFKNTMGRSAKISVVLTEREPIYIVGSITKPGTYKYAPGMTVMHALALSEGLAGVSSDFSRAAESIRERERLEKSAQHLQTLLARQAVFLAERESQQPVAPNRLVELAGETAAQALILKVVNERKLALAGREAQKSALEATIGAAGKELEILRGRMTHIEVSIKNRSERFDTLNSMQHRGALSDNTVYQARNELSDAEEREDGGKTSIAQIEEKLSQAQHDQMKLDMDAQIELNRELTTIENDIAEENLTLISGERLIRAAGDATHQLSLTPQNVSLVIVRRTVNGPKRLTANAMSLLQAGDLLEINPLQSTGATLADKL
jgi:polysaccharide biosynthesis/export protein ExoF